MSIHWGSKRDGWKIVSLSLVLIFGLPRASLAAAQPDSAAVVEVAFAQPHNISTEDGSIKPSLEAVKVIITGQGFMPRNAGPVVWLNGEPTLRVMVAEDGSSLEAYFYRPFGELEAANAGVWNVQIQEREGAEKVSIPGAVVVQRLSTEERAQLAQRKRTLGIQ